MHSSPLPRSPPLPLPGGASDPAPRLRLGHVTALRLFDVAYSIDLAAVERLWQQRPGASSTRARLAGTPAKAVAFDVPPVALALDPVPLDLGGVRVMAAATARFYDFGVVSLSLRVPVVDRSWEEFVALANAMDAAVGPRTAAAAWPALLEAVRATVGPAFRQLATAVTAPAVLEEDFLLAVAQEFDVPLTAAELERRVDLVPLLSGETRPLSEGARADLLRVRYSYYPDDLVALTWDRAFLYEPRGDSDVAEVLEVANAQLLEMRYYDELLDDELPRVYDLVEATRRRVGVRGARRYADLARRLYALVAEVTELTEKVDNALQVTEDVYLARVYSAALELFRVSAVSAAVDRKLAIIRDTYAALYEEASSSRAELLEIAIVVLIVMEILLALLRH